MKTLKNLFLVLTLLFTLSCKSDGQMISSIGQFIPPYSSAPPSNEGKTIYIGYSGFVKKSIDKGLSWTTLAVAASPIWINVSLNQQYISFRNGGSITSSSNGGTSFTDYALAVSTQCYSMCDNGIYRFITASSYGVTSYRYLSTNSGASFSPLSIKAYYFANCINGTGQYISYTIGGGYNGNIFVSSNYGSSFTGKSTSSDRYCLATDISGQYMLTGIYSGNIQVSNDYGNTWTNININKNWGLAKISPTGQFMLIADKTTSTGTVYYSNDYGVSFNLIYTVPAGKIIQSIDLTESGKYIAVGVSTDGIYLSSDYGANWSIVSSSLGGITPNTIKIF